MTDDLVSTKDLKDLFEATKVELKDRIRNIITPIIDM